MNRRLCEWKNLTVIQGNVWKDHIYIVLKSRQTERDQCRSFPERSQRDKDIREAMAVFVINAG